MRLIPRHRAALRGVLLFAVPFLLALPGSARACQFGSAFYPAVAAFVEELPFPTAPLYLVSSHHISSTVQALWILDCGGRVYDRLDNSPDPCVANQWVSQLPKALGPSARWTVDAPEYVHVLLEPALARLNARIVAVGVRDTTLVSRGSFRLLGPQRADRILTHPFAGETTTAVFTLEWPAQGEILLYRHDVAASGDSALCQERAPTWRIPAPQLTGFGDDVSAIESFEIDADGRLAISGGGMTQRFDPLTGLPVSVGCALARVEVRTDCSVDPCQFTAAGLASDGRDLWEYDLYGRPATAIVSPSADGNPEVLLLRDDATVDVLNCAGVREGQFALEDWFEDGVPWSLACSRYDITNDRYTSLVAGPQGFRLFTFTGAGLDGTRVPTDLEVRLDFAFAGDDTHPADFGELNSISLQPPEATVQTLPLRLRSVPYLDQVVDYTIDVATGEILSPEWFQSVRTDPADRDGRTLVWTDSKGREFTTSLPARPVLARSQIRMRDAHPGSILLADQPMPAGTGVARAPRLLFVGAEGQVVADQALIPEGSVPGSRIELVHLDEITPWQTARDLTRPAKPKVLVDLAVVLGEDSGERQSPGLIDLGSPEPLFPVGWLDGPVVGRVPPRLYLTNEPQPHIEFLINPSGEIRGDQHELPGRCSGFPERFTGMTVLDSGRLALKDESGRTVWLRSSPILLPIFADLDTPRIEGTAVVFDESGPDGRVDFGIPVRQALRASDGLAEVLLDDGGHWTLVEMNLSRPIRERQRIDLDALLPDKTVTRLVRATCGVTLLGGPDYIAFWPGRHQTGSPATWVHTGPVHGAETRFPMRQQPYSPEPLDHYLHAWAQDAASGFAEVAQFRSDPPEDEFGRPLPTWRRVFDTSDPYVLPMLRIQAVGHRRTVPAMPLWVVSPIGTQQYLTLQGQPCVPGDLDGNGQIRRDDLDRLLGFLAEETDLPTWQRCAADLDQDGDADLIDAVNVALVSRNREALTFAEPPQQAPHPWRILDRGADWWMIATPVPAPVRGLSLRVEAPEGAVRSITVHGLEGHQAAHEGHLVSVHPIDEGTELRIRIESAVEIQRVEAQAALDDGTLLTWPSRLLGNLTGVDDGGGRPITTRLLRPFPNPFNPRTSIPFELQRAQRVRLEIVDLRGRVIRHLGDGRRSAGHHEVVWDGNDDRGRRVASGAYRCRLGSEDGTFVHPLLLLR